jgi:hypothetical protein
VLRHRIMLMPEEEEEGVLLVVATLESMDTPHSCNGGCMDREELLNTSGVFMEIFHSGLGMMTVGKNYMNMQLYRITLH